MDYKQQAHLVLKEYWGYDSFRPRQLEIIRSALEGRDTLGILPTGGGKSITFQIPALLREGICLVVTPLIALMKDQVRSLQSRGIRAMAIHTGMSRHEVDTALNNAAYGDYKFLYLSPERLSTELFRSYLPELNMNFIVVDEAHCISQWGYDFRPDYLKIADIRENSNACIIALTATATVEVAADIMDKLQFTSPNLIQGSFARKNLSYCCRRTNDKRGVLLKGCLGTQGSAIVYVRSRNLTGEIADFLRSEGIPAASYHAGMDSTRRSRVQEDWISGRTRVMVCTNAFGMGIDKPDVRTVFHWGLPDSIESYFQEAGRAGRDGNPAKGLLLWDEDDCRRLRTMQKTSFPPLEYVENIYHCLHAYFDIPFESGGGRELKFDLKDFCTKYRLNRVQAFYAVKYLEKCGHWTYAQQVDVPTKVMVTMDRSALYGITLDDGRMLTVLEVLMRHYEGLFSFPVVINEELVAARSSLTVAQLRQMLYQLSLLHIIRYVPCTTSDVVYLHADRLHPKDVNLHVELYRKLQETSLARTEAMIDFVQDEKMCRSRKLLEYFGEKESSPCGICDVCNGGGNPAGDYRSKVDDGRCAPLEI